MFRMEFVWWLCGSFVGISVVVINWWVVYRCWVDF